MEDEGVLFALFVSLIALVIFLIWCMCGCPMPEEGSKQVATKTLVVKDPAKQAEIRKLPLISEKLFFSENPSCRPFLRWGGALDLDAKQAKFCLKVLLIKGGDRSSLRAFVDNYSVMSAILTFLESKGFISVKQYSFPAVFDEHGLKVKYTENYLVIDVTDLGRKYAEEVK
jgi:hypothetical protein